MFSTFVGLGRLISCQRPEYEYQSYYISTYRYNGIFYQLSFRLLPRKKT